MTTFNDLGVRDDLLKGIAEMGFEAPMPVQEKVIPVLLDGDHDLVALAQTGTGKTAAFGLPLIQRVDTSRLVPQALVLAPTRELCLQIAGDLADFAKYVPDISILPVYGGSSIESQIKALRRGVQIIIATPGRLIDLITRVRDNARPIGHFTIWHKLSGDPNGSPDFLTFAVYRQRTSCPFDSGTS